MNTPKHVLIAVAWPYVNGNLHIGHLGGYLLPADIEARYQRLIGNNVLMVSGSDCHGTPITVQADKEGKTPQEIADLYHERDVSLFFDVLHLSYDRYTRTDTAQHAKVTQDIFISLLNAGYVYIDTTKQYYSDVDGRFLPDRYIEGTCPHCKFEGSRSDQCDNCGKLIDQGELINPVSKMSQSDVYLKDTNHYFVDWSKLQPKIEEYVNRTSSEWKEWVAQETKGWLKEGLKPRPITRDIDWGVKIPIDRIPADKLLDHTESKRFYVWFDAVIGYLSASLLWSEETGNDWKPFWYGDNDSLKHYYFMGKDNLVFHTMFWPGKLMIHDPKLHLPDVPSINMFLIFDGKQFSKSRGVVIDSREIVEQFGNDAVRFYLCSIMPEKNDSSFSWLDFQQKVNSVLIGTFANYIHRVLSIASKVATPLTNQEELQPETIDAIQTSAQNVYKHLENASFKEYLEALMGLASYGNKRFDSQKVWELKDQPDRIAHELTQHYAIIVSLGILAEPLLLEGVEALWKQLGLNKPSQWPHIDSFAVDVRERVQQGTWPHTPIPLYKRVEDEDLPMRKSLPKS